MMNRRWWLKGAATAAAGCLFRPLPVQGFSSPPKPAYFPRYVDVAKEAGLLTKTVVVGHESKDFLLSTTGGGIALFDYDNDGWLDIFVVNGWGLKDFPQAEEPTNHLYHNTPDSPFTTVPTKSTLVHP